MFAADAVALLLLAALVVALHPGLALGGVLADLDAFAYFLPYRDAAAQALRAGQLPLWNPLLFGGAPFLANIQTAVFYPATWLGVVFDTPRAVGLTLLFHWWFAGAGMYLLCRTGMRLGRVPAWTGGVIFSLSGTLAAHAGHLNQVSAAAWLPWLVLLYEQARARRSLPLATLGAGAFALQLLAGHPQVSYLSGVAVGAVALWRAWGGRPQPHAPSPSGAGRPSQTDGVRSVPGALLRFRHRLRLAFGRVTGAVLSLGILVYMAGLGAALAAVQLGPATELSARSIRAGGMTMEQAAMFSLPPWELLRGLLPAYEQYPFGEYVAYLGVGPLVLAVAALRLRQRQAWTLPLALLMGGALLLALGHFLPLYWATYSAVPGVGLFRAPARWLLLWTFSGTALAAIGLHLVWRGLPLGSPSLTSPDPAAPQGRGSGTDASGGGPDVRPTAAPERTPGPPLLSRLFPLPRRHEAWGWGILVSQWRTVLTLLALLVLLGLSAWHDTLPAPAAVLAWAAAGSVTAGAVWLALRRPDAPGRLAGMRRPALGLLAVAVIVAELTVARQGLSLLTAYPPELATAVRPSLPALLQLGREGRVLSLVDTRFEPGDAASVQERLAPALTPDQAETFLAYSKLKEAAAANTGMLTGIGSLDGYDGGVLPLRAFGDLKRLLIESAARRAPPNLERLPPQPDGLLRWEVPGVPDAGLLAAAGVRGVVLDRLYDAWVDGAYYDLALVRTVEPRATLRLGHLPEVQATAVGLVTYLEGAAVVMDGAPVADVRLYDGDGGVTQATLRAGQDTAEGRYAAARPFHTEARAAAPWRAGGGQSYLARVALPAPRYVQRVEIESRLERGRVVLHGLSLLDERLGVSEPVVLDPAFRLTYLGDLKVYENLAWLPGVWAAFGAVVAPPGDAAAVPGVLPTHVLLERQPAGPAAALVRPLTEAAQGGPPQAPLRTTRHSPEWVTADVNLPRPGLVVFPEAAYPGWTAVVDGQPAEIIPANVLFQAVYVPEGRHRVEFRFGPQSLQAGWTVTRAALAWSAIVVAGWGLMSVLRRLRRPGAPYPSPPPG